MRTRNLLSLAGLTLLVLSNCGKPTAPADPLGDAVIVMGSNWTGQYDIWLRDSTDHLTDLTPSQPYLDQSPRWTPDGRHIVFESGREPLVSTMYIMNPDGSGVTTFIDTISAVGGVSWSPDGLQVAFQGYEDIWIANANGTQATRLTFGGGNTPAWSPDGQKIAFGCFVGTNPPNREICTINTDGTDTTNLTNNSGNEYSPAWSPDGQKIVFVSDRQAGQRFEVFIMNADGSEQTNLTHLSRDGIQMNTKNPIWTSDGGLIVFAMGTLFSTGDSQLYVMNPDGSNRRAIPNTPGAESVSFRP